MEPHDRGYSQSCGSKTVGLLLNKVFKTFNFRQERFSFF